jgi:meso-butanediol dehydrogenase/(S,S)-butanediol dehydrogenase/diacetyl reductase
MTNRLLLHGRVAIVTGAGSGIGRASALRFAGEGAAVLVADLRGHKAQECADEIVAGGGRAVAREVDVADGAQVQGMVQAAVAQLGGLDVLFNNAATTRLGTAVDLSAEDWALIWSTNVSSVFFGAKYAVPVMAERGGGSIISTASVSGLAADSGQVAYAATKAAVINLTRALAVDHAAAGVRANCICPGMTATPALLHALRADDHLREVGTAAPPLRRLAEPAEIAAAALWLASSESSYVTGETLVVDGGLTAQTHFSQIAGAPR